MKLERKLCIQFGRVCDKYKTTHCFLTELITLVYCADAYVTLMCRVKITKIKKVMVFTLSVIIQTHSI